MEIPVDVAIKFQSFVGMISNVSWNSMGAFSNLFFTSQLIYPHVPFKEMAAK